jgi:diguanylate cyclase (GGDEF)-like protein
VLTAGEVVRAVNPKWIFRFNWRMIESSLFPISSASDRILICSPVGVNVSAGAADKNSHGRNMTQRQSDRIYRVTSLISLAVILLGVPSTAYSAKPAPLTTLRAISSLSNAEAGRHPAVSFQATVTYFRSYARELFVQDGDTAIYVYPSAGFKLVPGDRILVRGTMHESFRPYVESRDIVLLSHGALPKPVRASFDQMIRAETDCRLVTARAIIRSANIVPNSISLVPAIYLQMLVDGSQVDADVDSDDENALKDLLDAEVEITGVVSGHFDNKMQQTGVLFHVQTLAGLKILKRAGVDPWSIAVTPMDRMITGYQVRDLTQRMRVQGTITYNQPGTALVLQDGARSLWITTQSYSPLRIGDRASAIGFPDVQNGFLTLTRSEVRDASVQAPVIPSLFTWEQLASGGNIGRSRVFDLVSIEGRVIAEVPQATQDEYVLEMDGHLFSAILHHPGSLSNIPHLPMKQVPPGSLVRVTGICILADANPFIGEVPFNILLRSFDDIAVVARPSLLNIRNLLLLVGLLLLVLIAAGARAFTLEHKVRRQSAALADIEQRRSRILEDLNGSRPLAEIVEQIAELVSFRLNGAPCWCQIANGARLGNCPAKFTDLRIIQAEVPARSGPPLGTLFAALDPLIKPRAGESEAVSTGAALATLAIETRKLYSDLLRRSEFDLLTDIHNRFSLEKRMDAQIELARQNAGIFGLIYIDLDRFKQVNDVYGHHIGDLYLQEVARRMKQQLRSHDLLARLGGDEFAALLPMVRNRADVEEISQRLEHCFEAPLMLEENVVKGSASFGIALYPEDGATKDSLLNVADSAMYAAKSHDE